MVGCVGNRSNPFVRRWYAVENDTGVGGWAVATIPAPVSVVDQSDAGVLVADLIAAREVAAYIAQLHNAVIGSGG